MKHKYRFMGRNEKNKLFKINLTLALIAAGSLKIWTDENKIIMNTITEDQFTTLIINDMELYENDIVETEYTINKEKSVGVIKMLDGCWLVDFTFSSPENRPYCYEDKMKRNFDYLKMFTPVLHNKIKLIGNIHEGVADGHK